MAKKKRRSYTASEKKSFKRGFLSGLRLRRKSLSGNSFFALAKKHARAEGAKYGWSKKEISQKAKLYNLQMRVEPDFRKRLQEKYK